MRLVEYVKNKINEKQKVTFKKLAYFENTNTPKEKTKKEYLERFTK